MVPDIVSAPDTCAVGAELLVCGGSAGLVGSFVFCCEEVYGNVAILEMMFMKLVIILACSLDLSSPDTYCSYMLSVASLSQS
jgi:hypothetical protein